LEYIIETEIVIATEAKSARDSTAIVPATITGDIPPDLARCPGREIWRNVAGDGGWNDGGAVSSALCFGRDHDASPPFSHTRSTMTLDDFEKSLAEGREQRQEKSEGRHLPRDKKDFEQKKEAYLSSLVFHPRTIHFNHRGLCF
jgi:hypothetical protein